MRPQKETVVIINLYPYKETSKLVTFLGSVRGKFSGIVQGAARLKGKWGGKLDLFCYGEVTFTAKQDAGLVTVTDFSSEECFYPIRESLEKLTLACYFAEIVNKVSQAEPQQLFVHFLQSLYYLKECSEFPLLRVYFEANMFNLLGIFPTLDSCIECGNKLSSSKLFFSADSGGEFCRLCDVGVKTTLFNRANIHKLLELASLQLSDLTNYQLTKSQLAEISTFCCRYREFHLGSDFKCLGE